MCVYLRPSEEGPAGVAGDGPVVSPGLLGGDVADGAHVGRAHHAERRLAGPRGHHNTKVSEIKLKTEIMQVVTFCKSRLWPTT